MPNETRDFGDLRVTLTKEFDWKYSDTETGAKRDGSFFHAKSQGDLRPLGSFITPNYQDQNNKRATLLVGNAPNGSGRPAVASPTGYSRIWEDRGSGGKHDGSIWKPTAPSGYVALGDVCVGNYNSPSTTAIWCVRSDLVLQSDFGADSVWSDSYSGAKMDVSVWPIVKPQMSVDGSDKIPVLTDLFIANSAYSKPEYSRAKVLGLPVPKDFKRFSADLPVFTKDKIPREGDVFDELAQCAVTLPFTAFFSPTDNACLNLISHPFITLQRRTAWYVEDVARNAADQSGTHSTKITKGVSATQSQEMTHSAGVSITSSFGIKAIGGGVDVTLNYQFTASQSYSSSEYQETEKTHTFNIGPQTVLVLLTDRVWIQATRSDGSATLHRIGYNATDDLSRTEIKLK
ncbi:hypothetical protein GT037_010859 [Alternaria burnsii]|uniref:Insecticidal crystal toxin domain-containing protein n=1 Tax=Alternaria burnsii TaxID=1187904 RepID=A0A8H7AWP7_9PLEO|nr:uncharacterized protein GT037_010859 [Alternaria burnsii]KAF7671078.1 hypothetical protein GT037_010859 [Alternaria burnsii]CAI9630216.1 unnamed protein product [Alternaria burnsii]